MLKNLKMELLNSEEAKNIKGGIADTLEKKGCSGTGDTIVKACAPFVGNIVIVWCETYEAKCTGTFTPCSSGVTSTCTEKFTLTPK